MHRPQAQHISVSGQGQLCFPSISDGLITAQPVGVLLVLGQGFAGARASSLVSEVLAVSIGLIRRECFQHRLLREF